MAEVKKNNRTKAKKSSKVLVKNNDLNSEELLEQILNKKKNKTQKSIAPRRKNNGVSSNNKRIVKKEEVSSDDIYDKIKAKKQNKKYSSLKKNNVEEKKLDIIEKIDKSKEELDFREQNDNKNDDLIITREIRFDDLSADLKNKKTLKELKDAIEEFDKLDDTDNHNKWIDDIDLLPSVKYSNYRIKKLLIMVVIILILFLLILSVSWGSVSLKNNVEDAKIAKMEEKKLLEEKKRQEEEEKKKKKLYEECLVRKITDADMTDNIVVANNELSTYLKDNYSVSVAYEDLTYGYSYSYDVNKVYYAASTIKSLVALYVYKSASEGKIDLDTTITYTSKYKVSYSAGVKNHKLGSKIPLRTLVKYSIIYSDNSAHQMLISYVGKNNLKEFGKSLGAKNTLIGGDNFGNISASDGLIYMKAINEFLENNSELGMELKSYFIEAGQKELAVDNLVVANKYGLYKKYYHNMGIVYDSSPYVISIMTLEGNNKKEKIVSDIAIKVNELHNLFKSNRRDVCELEVYGNKKSTSS